LEFIVRYQMPAQKFIKACRISKRLEDGNHLVVVSSEVDTIGWNFNEKEGLVKMLTIKNSYHFIEFLSAKNVFVGLRDTGDIEKIFCKTGKIAEVTNIEL
jgi:hypothetical protein